jgi:hypothetical protein
MNFLIKIMIRCLMIACSIGGREYLVVISNPKTNLSFFKQNLWGGNLAKIICSVADEYRGGEPVYLMSKEVAELTGVNEGTLKYWRSKGRGWPSQKRHGVVFYKRSDIEAIPAEKIFRKRDKRNKFFPTALRNIDDA